MRASLMRVSVGFVIAPMVPALLLLLITRLDGTPTPIPSQYLYYFLLASASFSYPAALLLGVPTFILYRRNNWSMFHHIVIAGVAIGALSPNVSYAVFDWLFYFPKYPMVFEMFSGAIAAVAFWVLVRPDTLEARPAA